MHLCTHADMQITKPDLSLQHGFSTVLNCTTDLAVNTIEWLDVHGRVLANGTDLQLELRVTLSDSGHLTYICRIKSNYGSQNKTITLTISAAGASNVSINVSVTVVMLAIILLFLLVTVITVLVVVR